MKKFLSLVLVLVFASSILISCSSNTNTGTTSGTTNNSNTSVAGEGKTFDGTVRIAWLGMNPDDRVDPISGITYKGSYAFKDMLEEKLPGITIEFIQIPSDGWIQKMGTTIENGEADIGWYTNQIMAAEWFVDHRDFMKEDPEFTEETFEATFTEGAKQYTRYRSFDYPDFTDAIYGLPYDVGSYYIMYDKQLLEEWGVSEPSMNPSFDELMEIFQKTTGINPVSGKQNYGTYVRPYWSEWLGVGADLYHSVDIPDMNLDNLDIVKDVDYILDSPKILSYFKFMEQAIVSSPPGANADSGAEKWLTSDNDIALMLDTSKTQAYYNNLLAGNTEVTDRFKPIFLPKGEQGVSGFPEVHHVAVTKKATDPKLAWEVVKLIATDKDVLNLLYENYAMGTSPALVDASGIDIMSDEFAADRYQDRLDSTFITDDYWYWREPIQKVFNEFFVGDLTPETARTQLHTYVNEWITNKQKQIG